ncbi:MAG: hypothetical protein MK211_00865 [Flavobacteriales bacterium]|jgi:hypothetical protein|uniref:hypothetical protein n=1 Tax=Candidatus Ulvibacter alkanivorans TaxID=2267620 RepID=UPI000DF3D4EF|nr:hypothetical protein [Candidatus Ulvibacter alkanivorans]MCH2488674.1 hypothetical protein [Flavobacteriales bacterium]
MRIITLLFLLLIIGCGKPSNTIQLEQLPGYWEIKTVELPNGLEKQFNVNTTIDFIEVNGDSGIRKKVAPQLDGTYRTSESIEKFNILKENDSVFLIYKTPYDTWRETIIKLQDSVMQVKNQDDKVYTYKRFRTFDFN